MPKVPMTQFLVFSIIFHVKKSKTNSCAKSWQIRYVNI